MVHFASLYNTRFKMLIIGWD